MLSAAARSGMCSSMTAPEAHPRTGLAPSMKICLGLCSPTLLPLLLIRSQPASGLDSHHRASAQLHHHSVITTAQLPSTLRRFHAGRTWHSARAGPAPCRRGQAGRRVWQGGLSGPRHGVPVCSSPLPRQVTPLAPIPRTAEPRDSAVMGRLRRSASASSRPRWARCTHAARALRAFQEVHDKAGDA